MQYLRRKFREKRIKLVLNSMARGQWHVFLEPEKREEWMRFINRRVNTPHCDKCVLRLTMNKGGAKEWFLWLVYEICEVNGDPHLHMSAAYIPDSTSRRFMLPDDILDEPYFSA